MPFDSLWCAHRTFCMIGSNKNLFIIRKQNTIQSKRISQAYGLYVLFDCACLAVSNATLVLFESLWCAHCTFCMIVTGYAWYYIRAIWIAVMWTLHITFDYVRLAVREVTLELFESLLCAHCILCLIVTVAMRGVCISVVFTLHVLSDAEYLAVCNVTLMLFVSLWCTRCTCCIIVTVWRCVRLH